MALITKKRINEIRKLRSGIDATGHDCSERLKASHFKELFEYINQLELAEEGAKEAFGTVVEEKRGLKAECSRLSGLLQSAYDDIRRLSKGA